MSGRRPRTSLEVAELRHRVMDVLTVVWLVLTTCEGWRFWRARR